MQKKIISFLILCFLSLQTFSFFHLAEYGFEEHHHGHEHEYEYEHENEHEDEHDQGVCEIYLFCEKPKDNNYKSVKFLEKFENYIFAFALKRNFVFNSKKYKIISTRAPPQFS